MEDAPPPSPHPAGDAVAPVPANLASFRRSRTLSFHDSVGVVSTKAPEAASARASRLRATTSVTFKAMMNPQNRSMLRKIEKQKADQKLQAKQLADLHRELERKARVIDATISATDLTERGPLSSSGAQGEVFKAVWKRMIPVAIKENKSGEWAGDLTAEMQLFLDLHHPHVVACYGILKETGAGGQVVNSIVTEKCSTSLDHFLKDNDNWTCFKGSGRLDQINLQKSTILLHVSQGLEKLHDMNILHRDIKCGNILLDGAPGECGECHHSGNWKICDFGEAKVLKPPIVRFAPPIKWREGFTHSLVQSKRFLPVTSSHLRSKGARFYCYIKPGETLSSTISSDTWVPCPHGGFAYLFGDLAMAAEEVLSNFDERSCVFPQTFDDTQQHVDLDFPRHMKHFGILPIRYKPFLNLEEGELTYEMPTSIVGWLTVQGLGDASRIEQWDAIEQELGHRCGLQNTLLDLAQLQPSVIENIAEKMDLHGSTVTRMLHAHESLTDLTDTAMVQLAGMNEVFGDVIKGQISQCCELRDLHESIRRKTSIPTEATHFVWAYQADGVDIEKMSEEHKKHVDVSSAEFAFASLGSFIYLKAGEVDVPPTVVGVNALGLGQDLRSGTIDRACDDNSVTATIASPEMWDGSGIGLETDIYAFGIVMWEVWTRCFAWHWMGAGAEFQICNRVGILKQRPRIPPFVGTDRTKLATMIRLCLHDNRAKRPTAAQLVEAQLDMVKTIRRNSSSNGLPVREASHHELAHQSSSSSAGSDDLKATQMWTSAGQYTLCPSHISDSGVFSLTVTDPDRNAWIENALVGDEDVPAKLVAMREKMKDQKLGIVFKTTDQATGEKVDHWPRVARVDAGLLASIFPEIRPNVTLERINGQPAPKTFKEAMPLLKTRPYTLEFSTLEDAVESVLAPSRKFGVHAPVVAAAMRAGIQAAYLVRRFEEGKSHHQTRAKLQEAEKMIEEKDAELERLKAQVLALGGSTELGSVPDAPPTAPVSSGAKPEDRTPVVELEPEPEPSLDFFAS